MEDAEELIDAPPDATEGGSLDSDADMDSLVGDGRWDGNHEDYAEDYAEDEDGEDDNDDDNDDDDLIGEWIEGRLRSIGQRLSARLSLRSDRSMT